MWISEAFRRGLWQGEAGREQFTIFCAAEAVREQFTNFCAAEAGRE